MCVKMLNLHDVKGKCNKNSHLQHVGKQISPASCLLVSNGLQTMELHCDKTFNNSVELAHFY